MIKTITPRMLRALDTGKKLFYCADIWKSVLNAKIDTQADLKASVGQSNMDFDTSPGFARLGKDPEAYIESQTSHNASESLTWTAGVWGTVAAFDAYHFYQSPGRLLTDLKLRVDNSAAVVSSAMYVYFLRGYMPLYPWYALTSMPWYANDGIVGYQNANCMAIQGATVAAGFSGEVDFPFNMTVPEGWYTLLIIGNPGVNLRYQNADVLAMGQLRRCGIASLGVYGNIAASWSLDLGDPYLIMSMSGYYQTGEFTTKTMDLGKVPADTGFYQMAVDMPTGTNIGITLYGSTTGEFAGEETTYTDVVDGQVMPAGIRYWRVRMKMYSNDHLDQTPLMDMVELYYPDDRIRFRQRNVKLYNVAEDIKKNFSPLLVPGTPANSELKPIERVASLGSFPLELQDSTPDALQRLVSDAPLKNYRAALYLGADEPGFTTTDLLRVNIGIIESVHVKPQYRGDSYALPMTVKNPILDLKRKAPVPSQTGLLDFESLSIDHDGMHVMDSMLDIMRGKAGIPARYIDIASFNQGRETAGGGYGAPELHIVRRADNVMNWSDGTAAPDTRIKNPTEIVQLLAPLLVIADGYIVVDEASRIKYIQHDATSTDYEETWADEKLVKSGDVTGAIPIESVEDIDLGYDTWLYNCVICGCEWRGNGTGWGTDFVKVYGDLNEDSADDFAPGADTYISIMEANMTEVSKWLGSENGYNGETLAQNIAARLNIRFSYPPVRMTGVVVPISQLKRGLGSVIRVWSKELAKYGRRGIAPSESKRFMITKQDYDQAANRVRVDLLELT
jgi:hypothetical protein